MKQNGRIERPGREIKIDGEALGNNNVTIKIGTTENKNAPETVYIIVTFWVDIKNKKSRKSEMENFDNFISSQYSKELKKIKTNLLKDTLSNSKYFPFFYDNIYTFDFPENLNYNNKRSFTTLELTLHTLNSQEKIDKKLPFRNKFNTEIFDELVSIATEICSCDLLKGNLDFKIYKSKD